MDAKRTKYEADPLAALMKESHELNWLIEHWIEQGTLAVLVGPEGSYKSFLAIDWALSIASESKWQGSRVSTGKVLYIAGEGRTGVIRRMKGWCDYYELAPEDVFLGRRAVELIVESDVDRLKEYLKGQDWALIIVDTLARNYGPGSENDAETMNAAIANADRIREEFGATVLLVHHAPLEGRSKGVLRPRGSSALAGAADAIFTCSYDKESKVISVSSTKQKDAAMPETRYLSYDIVDLGQKDNFGNPITTVVLCATHLRPVQRRALGKNQKRLVQELRSRANGDHQPLVAIREVTEAMNISRESRKKLEAWFTEQSWARPTVGGHIVDMAQIPGG